MNKGRGKQIVNLKPLITGWNIGWQLSTIPKALGFKYGDGVRFEQSYQ